ncbi:MAG: TlpA family protein disulfide reductase [Pedobacter sp.]|nr:MAG: TlpA family protein disulfide reductase [Pedobacter sp.]
MRLIPSILLFCLLVPVVIQVQGQALTILPARPERGTEVTVTYDPNAAGAKIKADAKEVTMVFTYSTFYELPWKLPMRKSGDLWVAKFTPQRYATFATFYLQSGTVIDQPAADRHYSIPVYAGSKRVLSGYLHESYSLGAQKPKSPDLPKLKLALLKNELRDYPDNYEAKVSRLSILMNTSKGAADRLKYREEARKIIADKFASAPTVPGNVNKVTMGYLMIGEKSRLDSVRQVIADKYPQSDMGKDLLVDRIAKSTDTADVILQLEALLATGDEAGEEGSGNIHSRLFQLYAAKRDSTKALLHAAKLGDEGSPQLPNTLKEISETLTNYEIAPAAAIAYADRAFMMADKWPVGIIRYFPEFGHIPSFVADTVRAAAVNDAKGELLALQAVNYLRQGKKSTAVGLAAGASEFGNSRDAILNIAAVYKQLGLSENAYNALWKLLLSNPSDTVALAEAKTAYLGFNKDKSAFDVKVKEFAQLERNKMMAELQKKMMNLSGPELNGLTDLEGKPVTAEMMNGKIVILDFWATWCVPCIQEMPYFQKVYDKYKSNPDIMFMVVNNGSNNTIEDARKWAKQNTKYTFPIYFNNDKSIGEKVGFSLIPTIAVIDKTGKMQFRTIGFEGPILEKKLSVEIDLLLGERAKL